VCVCVLCVCVCVHRIDFLDAVPSLLCGDDVQTLRLLLHWRYTLVTLSLHFSYALPASNTTVMRGQKGNGNEMSVTVQGMHTEERAEATL
jgi:hypothetical protein